MLKLSFGIWKDDSKEKFAGSFTVFGKRFQVYVDPNPNKGVGRQPEYFVSIVEFIDKNDSK